MARRLRLTKKTAIIFGAVIVVLSGALGYLLWRVNQTDTTAPTDSDASCPGDCYWHAPTNQCVGVGGCIWVGDGAINGGTSCDASKGTCTLECDECESDSPPIACEFYSDGITNNNYSNGDLDVSSPGYYECDSSHNCIPCTPVSSEAIPSISDCQSQADELNGSLTEYCPEGQYKWSCQQLSDGTGYVLEQIPCVDDSEEPSTNNCGTEPTNYSYNSAPTTQIGPFPQDGKVVLFYKSLNDADYRPLLTFTGPDGQTYSYKMPTLDSNKRAKVETEIEVSAGDYITLVSSNDDRDQGDPECAPTENNPKYISLGWIAPQSGQCGSGLDGPPTGGTQTPMATKSITADVAWVEGLEYDIVDNKGQQCWADWREWPGDYDFEDYFLMISYDPVAEIVENNPDWDLAKNAIKSCIDDNTTNATAEVTYTITVENTGDGDGEISKVVDTLDESILDSFIVTDSISDSGVYSNGVITWDYTSSPLSISAGESKTFTYKIRVDSDHFAVYGNSVELTPVGSEKIQATESVTAVCNVPGAPGEVPQTGLFDSTISRVIAGFVLVLGGAIVYNLPVIRKDQYKYRERFEKKVANK